MTRTRATYGCCGATEAASRPAGGRMIARVKATPEAEVAKAAEAWLLGHGHEVYREVRDGYGGARADLVGLSHGMTHVVECKTRLSLDLIEQAHGWLGRSELVSVCVPEPRHHARLSVVVLRQLGVGLLTARHGYANVGLYPRWHRLRRNHAHRPVRALLHESQRVMGEAGTKSGGYYTAFRQTMTDAAEYVAAHPGCSVREVMADISHHYASERGARQGLVFALNRGLCSGVRSDRGAREWRLYPEPKA